jgi:endoglucanase
MITEFGASNGTECASYVTDIITYMADNDVYIGWTAWAAGPLWGSASACCASSENWGSLEPGSLASDGSPGMYTTVWLQEIEPLLPTTLQTSGMSSVNGPGSGSVGSSSSSSVSTSSTKTSTSSTKTSTSSTKTSTSSTKTSTSSTKTSTSSTKTTTSTASPSATGVALYGQCGGETYTGSTVCATGSCMYSNPWYSQCLL